MSIHADSNWWKDLFDEVYLQTDARTVCNDELTAEEVNFLIRTLNLHPAAPILDLCGGQGRHSLELSRRGFENVTVLDYSGYLINMGKKIAGEENLGTGFIQADARDTGLRDKSFQYVIVMAGSFGYFPDEDDNIKILKEACRLLTPSGTLLLDMPDRDYIIRNFKPFSSHKSDNGITVNRTRELGDDIIFTMEKVTSGTKGSIRNRTYCIRLYSPEKITGLLQQSGFSSVSFIKDFMSRQAQGDYGCMTNRMVVSAKK